MLEEALNYHMDRNVEVIHIWSDTTKTEHTAKAHVFNAWVIRDCRPSRTPVGQAIFATTAAEIRAINFVSDKASNNEKD